MTRPPLAFGLVFVLARTVLLKAISAGRTESVHPANHFVVVQKTPAPRSAKSDE
jgi:hypothetical protein